MPTYAWPMLTLFGLPLSAKDKEGSAKHGKKLLDRKVLFAVVFVTCQTIAAIIYQAANRIHDSSDGRLNTLYSQHSFFTVLAGVAGLELVLAILAFIVHARIHRTARYDSYQGYTPAAEDEHSLELLEANSDDSTPRIQDPLAVPYIPRVRSSRSNLILAMIALLYAGRSSASLYLIQRTVNFYSVTSLIISVAPPILSAIVFCISYTRTIPTQQWLGIILQICGILSTESSYITDIPKALTYLSFAFALFSSSLGILTYHNYFLHAVEAPHKLNLRLISFIFGVHLALAILSAIFDSGIGADRTLSLKTHVLPLFMHAVIDFVSLNIIFYYGPIMLAMLTPLSTTLLIAYFHGTLSIGPLCGVLVAFLGFLSYTSSNNRTGQVEPERNYTTRALTSFISIPLIFIVAELWRGGDSVPNTTGSSASVLQHQFNPLSALGLLDHVYVSPDTVSTQPACDRSPLPSMNYFSDERTYHQFDDVLLIVFFSHARYDVNLDYYREVYAEFFPNMVFIGPKSREDMGFTHSYDVFVDSYESDEDISDWSNYKMAGRMAHHMLYTILTTPPYSTSCYKGFLWAPFDTLLNIPRLQQFDQSKIWYFSPWGKYVANPAVDEEVWRNASNHAPPARISPDPETNWEETYRGWWMDWWWGDPHYGIPVCKTAFENISKELRQGMATRFLDGATRYIGGSADTLYLPAHVVPSFLEVFAAFLNTSCFLEIAVPTAVHLIVPPEEDILFVDHWWIWEEPLNATFVRNIWAEGKEVDTFHTFHWGEKDANGVWHARPDNIDDVRRLQRESAARQGLDWFPASG